MIKLILQEYLTRYPVNQLLTFTIFFDMELLFSSKEVFDTACLVIIINMFKNNLFILISICKKYWIKYTNGLIYPN
jgi:hypothetical protein